MSLRLQILLSLRPCVLVTHNHIFYKINNLLFGKYSAITCKSSS